MKSLAPDAEPAGQKLVARILSSRQFAHAHMLKRVLSYLYERSKDPNTPPPKEYEIAVEVMGRPASFDPRTDPIVRVTMASIRDRLLAYFATEGKNEGVRLTVPKGQYGVVFADAQGEDTRGPAASATALARFWRPYFAGQRANVVVYTEPLFFRDDKGHYFRDWYLNDPKMGLAKLQGPLSKAGFGTVEPSYHYLSTGEVHCMLSITRMFHEMGVPIETRNSRICSWNELQAANLILLGSPRTNSFLDALQGEQPFVTAADHIGNLEPRASEKATYKGRRYLDGKLVRRTEFAVVTRRPGLSPGSAVTMIAANHGRAIQGAGHLLTLEDRVDNLLDTLSVAAPDDLPGHCQLLMRVDTVDYNDEVVRVECIASRILEA
jgi:hypothetical protein